MSGGTILLDMDGPLADFDRHFWDRCTALGYTFDVVHYDHQSHRYFIEHIPNRRERKAARAMVDAPGWFAGLPVTPGATEGVAALLAAGLDVWVCTKPLEANPTCLNDKHAWLEANFPALADRLITAPDKSMVHGSVLIDDAPNPAWFDRATWAPVVFDAPYNRAGTPWADLPRFRWADVGDWVQLIHVHQRARPVPQQCPRCAGEAETVSMGSFNNPYSLLVHCVERGGCGWSLLVDYQAAHP